MTEADIPLLHVWLRRPHVAQWWRGGDGTSLDDIRAKYLPRILAQERVAPYIAMLDGHPLGYAQSYVALGSGDGTKIQTDPAPDNFRAIRCYEKAGFRRVGPIVTPDGPAMYMVRERCRNPARPFD